MLRSGVTAVLTALAVVVLLAPQARAEKKAADKKEVKLIKEWKGSVADGDLAKGAPEYVTNAKDFGELWKNWKLEGKAPTVDFKKEIVIVSTTVGSRLNLSAKLDDKGNLEVVGLATSDFGEGFRYVMATVSREGVKSINGKEIKEGGKDKE
jgi:hypothetical protein